MTTTKIPTLPLTSSPLSWLARPLGPTIACLALLGPACSMPNPDYLGGSSPTSTGSEADDEGDSESDAESGDQGHGEPMSDMGGATEQDPESAGDESGADESTTTDEPSDMQCALTDLDLAPQCSECLELSCCIEVDECMSDADCECVFTCLAEDGLGLACALSCGLDSLDQLPILTSNLLACTDLDCSDECPALEL